MAKKRSPPLSHLQKYREIKQKAKAWKVDIPKPTTPATKAMVSKYHRLLFGGRTKSGKYTVGMVREYKPTTVKNAKVLDIMYHRKGAARIGAHYYPKNLGTVKRIGKKSVTFESPVGTTRVPILKPSALPLMTEQERVSALSNVGAVRDVRITIGTTILPYRFEDWESFEETYELVTNQYAESIATPIFIA